MRSSLLDQGKCEFRSLAIKTTFTEFSKNCSNMDINTHKEIDTLPLEMWRLPTI